MGFLVRAWQVCCRNGRYPSGGGLDRPYRARGVKSPMKRVVVFTALICLVRAGLSARYFVSGSPVAFVFGFSELSVCVLTILALGRQTHDVSARGLVTPFLYVSPLLLAPCESVNLWVLPLMFTLAFYQLGLRIWMGHQVSVGVPKFGTLVDSGPFRHCRHPLALTEMLLVATFCVAHPTSYNITAGLFALLCINVSVNLEERFLDRFAVYRDYVCRVPNRFIP